MTPSAPYTPALSRLIQVAAAAPRGGFINVHRYTTARGKIADYLVSPAASYWRVVRRSLTALDGLTPAAVVAGCGVPSCDRALAAQVLGAVRASYLRSLERMRSNVNGDRYQDFGVGLRLDTETNIVYLSGLLVRATIRRHVTIKPTVHRTRTLVRQWVESHGPMARFLRLRLSDNWVAIRLGGQEIRRSAGPVALELPFGRAVAMAA